MKKSGFFSAVLAVAMICSFGAVGANAESGGSADMTYEVSIPEAIDPSSLTDIGASFEYEENADGTISITKASETGGYDDSVFISIPDRIDGKTVTAIKSLGGEGGIVKLPSTLKEIGDRAFWHTRLYDNKLPEGLERIGDNVSIDGAINRQALIMPSTLKYIGSFAFTDSGEDIVLNDGLEYIGSGAFGYSDMGTRYVPEEITIPKTVKYIGWDAFACVDAVRYEGETAKTPDKYQEKTTFKIYGGGYVEKYMKSYLPNVSKGKTEPIGYKYEIIGQVDSEPSQTESVNGLKVSSAIPEGAEFKAVATTTKWLDDPLFCYEISLNKDGAEVQPDGYITISIPCEYGNGYVVYIDEETGAMENLNSIYVDGYYVFVTDHLSQYGIKFESEPVKVEESEGDVNGDESTDIADALLVARFDAGLVELSDAQQKVADVNKDDSVDIADALMIARYDAKLIDSF